MQHIWKYIHCVDCRAPSDDYLRNKWKEHIWIYKHVIHISSVFTFHLLFFHWTASLQYRDDWIDAFANVHLSSWSLISVGGGAEELGRLRRETEGPSASFPVAGSPAACHFAARTPPWSDGAATPRLSPARSRRIGSTFFFSFSSSFYLVGSCYKWIQCLFRMDPLKIFLMDTFSTALNIHHKFNFLTKKYKEVGWNKCIQWILWFSMVFFVQKCYLYMDIWFFFIRFFPIWIYGYTLQFLKILFNC
jgi:hypothetical protein